MKNIYLACTLAFVSALNASSPAPWPIETPRGVERAGELEIMTTTITMDGTDVACYVRRDPILEKEWKYGDMFDSYEWESPLRGDFKYVNGPGSGPSVTIQLVPSSFTEYQTTLHVRRRQDIVHEDGKNFTPWERGTAYSYGETELKGSPI